MLQEALAAKQVLLAEAHAHAAKLMDSMLLQQEVQAHLEQELQRSRQQCEVLVAQARLERQQEDLA